MGRLQGIMVDIEGLCAIVDFEVIKIIDDNNPYPMLLGIDWATHMNGVVNLKKRKMIFEKNSLRVVVSLDPVEEGSRYTKPVDNYDNNNDLDYIYKKIVWKQDWVNPTVDGRLSWQRKSSYTSDWDEEIEQCKN